MTSDAAVDPGPRLSTARLLMRRWTTADREPFARLNADPEVARYLNGPMIRAQSDALADRIEAGFLANGFGLWAIEVMATGEFIGFTGLSRPRFAAKFMPAVEVGWRLARPAWGKGYATEAAQAALEYGFGPAGLDEIVSFTTGANLRSRAVMDRLGMTHDEVDDFDHPMLAADDPLRPHVLYRLTRGSWQVAPSPNGSPNTAERPARSERRRIGARGGVGRRHNGWAAVGGSVVVGWVGGRLW